MRLLIPLFLIICLFSTDVNAQDKEKKKIVPISRTVKGEIITAKNDTLIGKIKIENAEDYYITSISFKGKGGKRLLTAFDVKWFRQVVPYPDREAYGVDEVFFISGPHPEDKFKKVFLPAEK